MQQPYSKIANGGRGPKPSQAKPTAGTPSGRVSDSQPNPLKQLIGFNVSQPVQQTVQPAANERMLFGANVLIGYKVEVQVKSGAVYEGIFHTMQFEGKEVHIVLKYAKLLKDFDARQSEKDALAEKPAKTHIIYSSEVVQIVAKDVKLNPEDLAAPDRGEFGFETDASIGRGRGGAGGFGRELQRWAPDDGEDSSMFRLEDTGSAGAWDQFAVNKEKFGVETNFREELYTSRLDPTLCGISEEEAARLAAEIEKSNFGTTNIHILEERGAAIDSGVEEEELYSAVTRQPPPAHYQHADGKRPRMPAHHQHAPPTGAGDASSTVRAPAWGGMGAGVAAVSGRAFTPSAIRPPPPPPQQQQQQPPQAAQHKQQQQPPPPPGAPPPRSTPVAASAPIPVAASAASPSAPIEIDVSRREVNKLRSQLAAETGTVIKSPYGTPKGTRSPLVGDPLQLKALNLEPGTTPIDDETRREFLRWKEAKAAESGLTSKKSGQWDEFKSFQANFKAKQQEGANGKPSEGGKAEQQGLDSPSATPSTAAASISEAPTTAAADTSKAAASEASTGKVTAPSIPATTAAKPAEVKKTPGTSSLNPNAKPFTLNFSAKEFVMPLTTTTPKPAAPTTSPAPAAASAGSSFSSSKQPTPATIAAAAHAAAAAVSPAPVHHPPTSAAHQQPSTPPVPSTQSVTSHAHIAQHEHPQQPLQQPTTHQPQQQAHHAHQQHGHAHFGSGGSFSSRQERMERVGSLGDRGDRMERVGSLGERAERIGSLAERMERVGSTDRPEHLRHDRHDRAPPPPSPHEQMAMSGPQGTPIASHALAIPNAMPAGSHVTMQQVNGPYMMGAPMYGPAQVMGPGMMAPMGPGQMMYAGMPRGAPMMAMMPAHYPAGPTYVGPMPHGARPSSFTYSTGMVAGPMPMMAGMPIVGAGHMGHMPQHEVMPRMPGKGGRGSGSAGRERPPRDHGHHEGGPSKMQRDE